MPSAGDSNPNAPAPDASAEAPARESMSLKRGREGSVDLLATPSIVPIVTKKNRIEEETAAENTDDESIPLATDAPEAEPAASSSSPKKETRTVGEVRKKVEEMTWKEGKKEQVKELAEADTEVEVEGQGEATNGADSDSAAVDKAESDTSDQHGLKRKANDQCENGVTSEEKKRKSTSPTPTDQQTAAPAEPEKKPQATFGSFSAKSSPFATKSGASPFGAASSSSPFAASASASSPFAPKASSTSAFGSAATKPADAAASASKGGFAGSGFGNYSNAFSTFAKKPAAEDSATAGPSTSFGDILKERGEEVEETKLQLDKQDVLTGEEEESTVYQTRVKLFALDDDIGGWKERGVGSLKLNKRRDGASGGRLVMRTDGVLRVILNSSLYVGMQCLEDGKHVRTSVFEGKHLRHLTIRTANPKTAAELSAAIHEHMPLESRKPSASPEAPKTSEVEKADKAAPPPAAEVKEDAEEDEEAAVGGEGADENV